MDNPLHPSVVPLLPTIKNYKWGKTGRNSLVARLHSQNSFYAVQPDEPYAELWIGTHPKSPSIIAYSDEMTLNEFVSNETIEVEPDKVEMYTRLLQDGLPYLFKVLSVGTPLSIQAHPDKTLAGVLHKKDEEHYPDRNHKPEMSVALSNFELMYGFQPREDIVRELARVPEFANAIGRTQVDAFVKTVKLKIEKPETLQKLFAALMRRDVEQIENCADLLAKRLKKMNDLSRTTSDELFLRLYEEYPGDVGCFSAYLLNFITLDPGQAIFIPANEPHAYVSGDCVEIMACSDNVVRAGLTSKFKDVDTLVDMLTYDDNIPEIFNGDVVDKYAKLYCPPVREFQLYKIELPPNIDYVLASSVAPTILLVISGQGFIHLNDDKNQSMLPLCAGSVYYLKAGGSHSILSTISGVDSHDETPLILFRAGINETLEIDGRKCSIM